MLEQPQIVESPAQLTAVIRLTVSRNEIRNVMGRGYSELMSAVASQGVGPFGPWFSHHLRMDPEVFDFEIGVPVKSAVSPIGRVQGGSLPATKVAQAVYQGPYEGLGQAWEEFNAWIAAQGLKPATDFWECYVAGPDTSADPATWRTELNRPLID